MGQSAPPGLTALGTTPQPPKSVHRPQENYAELCELKCWSKNWNRTSGEAPRGGEEGSHLQGPPCWGVSCTHRRPLWQESPGLCLGAPDSEQVLIVGTGRPPVVAWRFAAAQRAPRFKANGPRIQISPDAGCLMWGWLPISPPTGHCWSRNRHTKRLGGGTSLDNED